MRYGRINAAITPTTIKIQSKGWIITMAKDPYSVLGVNRNATDDEIKKAYRELARKYHPDNYAGNPLADLVEEKMKEVNEAYDAIQKERAAGGSSSKYSSYTYSGITSFAEVRRLISEGKYSDAELIIDSTPSGDRGAEWNFLKGVLLSRRGYFYDAQKHIETACYLDPQNVEYRNAKNNLRYQAGSFGGSYRQSSGSNDPDCCSICTSLLIMDACCDCCGGSCC